MPPHRPDPATSQTPAPLPMADPASDAGPGESPAAFRLRDPVIPAWTPPHQLDLPLPVDPLAEPPDPALLARLGAAQALRNGLCPWRRRNGNIVILTASPQDFARNAAFLTALYGDAIRPLPCPRPLIEAALLVHGGAALAAAADARAPAIASTRSFDRLTVALVTALLLAALGLAALLQPAALIFGLLLLSALSLAAGTALKIVAALAATTRSPAPPPLDDAALPTLSLLVALYGESEIVPRLIRRLCALDYPRDRLDTVILVEADDTPTRTALSAIDLPRWMRVIPVPTGQLRTKPRALNFGLDFTRGDIVGVYDAEDRPAPDQLRQVAASFAAAPPRTGCLQGALDFYNPRTNWIARCFTMEYAVWFRLFLPGLARLGLPLPLGGTTLFLRRAALLQVGAWDSHNVTEDADLGLRLARHGWRTAILPSVTMEEANCQPLPWIRQRARWTKGYLLTWLVHMRRPAALWRDLGPRGFAAVQAMLLCTLLQVILAPLHWWLLLSPPQPGDPLLALLPPATLTAILALFVAAQGASLLLTAIALRRTDHRGLWLWLPLTPAYFVLATLAAAKAMAEACARPFHWDKTQHGRHDPDA